MSNSPLRKLGEKRQVKKPDRPESRKSRAMEEKRGSILSDPDKIKRMTPRQSLERENPQLKKMDDTLESDGEYFEDAWISVDAMLLFGVV